MKRGTENWLATSEYDFDTAKDIVEVEALCVRLAPIAYTPAQFDNAPSYAFASEIRRTGKVIYRARSQSRRKWVSTKSKRRSS